MRKSPLLALPVVVLFLLSGCSSSAPVAPSSSVPSASPTGAASTPVASGDPGAPVGQCADDALAVRVTGGDAGAGNVDYAVTFTNTGGSSCALEGAPGVSVVGKGNGTQLGVPAVRASSPAPTTVSVAPGASASADLRVVNIGTDGGALGAKCAVTSGDGYRVYPPHSFVAVFVARRNVPACGGSVSWMTIGPVTANG